MLKSFLKNAGLITDEPAPVTAPTAKIPTVAVTPKLNLTATAGTGEPNAEVIQALNADVANTQNKAYEEYMKFYNTLEGLPDAQRTTMSLKLLSNQGVTAVQVSASLEERLARLDASDKAFAFDLSVATEAQVTGIDTQISEIETNVDSLKSQIRELEQKKIDLTRQRAENEITLDQERATYEASSEVVRQTLASEKERIIRHISPVK